MRTALIAALIVLVITSSARAQEALARDYPTSFIPFGVDDLAAFTDAVKLQPEQAQAARTLMAGAKAAAEVAQRRGRRAAEAIYMEAEAAALKPDEIEAKTGAECDRMVESYEKIERELLADWKSLLDAAQAERWPVFERTRRRAILRWVAGSPVDLTREVRGMKLTLAEVEAVGLDVGRYEAELDALLLERRPLWRALRPWRYARNMWTESDERAKVTAVDERIVELCRRWARTIADRLPADRGGELIVALDPGDSNSFIEWGPLLQLGAVKGLSDEQSTRLRRLAVSAEREYRALATDFLEMEKKREAGQSVAEDTYQKAVDKALGHRVELRVKLWKSALAVLTPEQRSGYEDGTDPAKPAFDRDNFFYWYK